MTNTMTFEQWQATRKRVESLGDEFGIDHDGPAFIYESGNILINADGSYTVIVCNEDWSSADLGEMERKLWEQWAKDDVGARTPESADAATFTALVDEFNREVEARNLTREVSAEYLLKEVVAQHGNDHADAVFLTDLIARKDAAIAKLVPELGDRFSEILREWLTKPEWAEMRRRNIDNPPSGSCASHDFCDANMAMLEAFEKLMGRDLVRDDGMTVPDLDLVNAAWSYAKRKHLTEGVPA